jgi:hypothetical protein
MGFLSGRVSFARYRVSGAPLRSFSADKIDKLAEHAIGTARRAAADSVEVGWTAGEHLLDTQFHVGKNVINDALHFGFRVDVDRPPAELLRAYAAIELRALAPVNPSPRHKRQARAAALERIEKEARDGRFTRRRLFDLLWDGPANELLIAGGGAAVLDRLHEHFHQTFGRKFEPITAGTMAFSLAEARGQARGVDDARVSAFVPTAVPDGIAWAPDERSRDFLGNEFLLWLWFRAETDDGAVRLADDSEAAVLPARTLVLECPRGETGKESIASDAPTRLPEAKRAIQAGKLPRKCGLTIERRGDQFDLTLSAESLAVSGATLPAVDDVGRAEIEERVTRIRGLIETLDLLYDAFIGLRTGSQWNRELAAMRKWLGRGD